MEHIFLLKIKGNDHECKNNYTIKRVQNFNVVKDRLGIKEEKSYSHFRRNFYEA